MSSKSKRRNVRAKRRRDQDAPQITDPHLLVVIKSLGGMTGVMAELAGEPDPARVVEARLAAIVSDLTAKFALIDPPRIIEIARLACLPWSWTPAAGADGGPTRAELLALLAVTAASTFTATGGAAGTDPEANSDTASGSSAQPLTNMIHSALPDIDTLLQLAQIREMIDTDEIDALGMIAVKMRGTEVWMRNTSYPEMVATTLRQLFVDPQVEAVLRADLGFDADQAVTVLESCHSLQVQRLNQRMQHMFLSIDTARRSIDPSAPDPSLLAEARQLWDAAWDAESDTVSVSVDDIVTDTGLDRTTVAAVLDHFRLDIRDWTPRRALDEFTSGNNPLRTHPVIHTSSGRAMLVHNAQVLGAIRENLEQHLKGTAVWENYQMARGNLLERRTQTAFKRVLPEADNWDGFEYYVPADAAEAQGQPSGYTKRVEGDHLFVQDDVAIIVEDKAVAISPRSRAGETRKLRGDLTSIVKKASEQAGRLQDRIQQDGGLRLHGSGWLDLSHVREIHTVAVSLDDLPGISTTTAELVQAGLLDADHIPWTVSLHDLDLITNLIDLPAEFLLYLRRRRDPQVTVLYTAPDELDLFLHFFQAGLYVEPDPDKARELVPYLPAPTTAERRRYRKQAPAYLTSRTDPLDAWYYSTLASLDPVGDVGEDLTAESGETDAESVTPVEVQGNRMGPAEEPAMRAFPKPKMAPSPLRDLIVAVQERGDYAWLSIGATLLSGSFSTQAKLARVPSDLLANPWGDGRGRSMTIPFASDLENGWLLVWMTRPAIRQPDDFEQEARDYLRAKKHQLQLPRGAAFLYDERSKELINVIYDGHIGDLEPRLQERQANLQPASQLNNFPHPNGKRRPGSKSARSQSRNRKKRS